MDPEAPFEIRSFRSVFALERRIYRIDTLRLNPSGVPLRGIGYAVALVLVALVAGAVPPTAWLDPLVPWYARDIAMPLAAAALFASVRLDGRPFHLAVRAILGHALGPRRLAGLEPAPPPVSWSPAAVVCLPDGSDARFRALRYRGPGAVLVARAHTRADRRTGVVLRPQDGNPARTTVLELAPGALLEVRPG